MAQIPLNEKGYIETSGGGGPALGAYNAPPTSAPAAPTTGGVNPALASVPRPAAATPVPTGLNDPNIRSQLLAGLQNLQSRITASSNQSRAEVDTLGKDIKTESKKTKEDADAQRLRDLADQERAQIDRERSALSERYGMDVRQIEDIFNASAEELKAQQKQEFAGRSVGLITSGGYLGTTQSQEGVLQNLRQSQRREVGALTAKKIAAIQAAQNAYEDRDFKLAREKITLARDAEKDIINAKNSYADRELKVAKENRDQSKDLLELLSNTDQEPTAEQVKTISSGYGITPDQLTGVIKAARQASAAESEKAQFDNIKRLADVSRALPAGTEIPLPNGKTMTAIGNAGDIAISHITDSFGNVTQIMTNKITGEQQIANLGRIGKGASPENGGVDILTLQDRKKLYPSLPLSLVGRSEQRVIADLESINPPDWYRPLIESKLGRAVDDNEVAAQWGPFRTAALNEMKAQVQKEIEGPVANPFEDTATPSSEE